MSEFWCEVYLDVKIYCIRKRDGVGWSRFLQIHVGMDWNECISDGMPTLIKRRILKIKISRSHIWLEFIRDNSVWFTNTLCKTTWLYINVNPPLRVGPPNQKSRVHTINMLRVGPWKINNSCSHYKILYNWSKFVGDEPVWLTATLLQNNVARTTRRTHFKSRILEIKSRVHIIKFYRNWLKFVGDEWLNTCYI